MVLIPGLLRIPVVGHFTAGNGGQGLIDARVDAGGKKMDRAVAKKEIRSRWRVHAVERIGVENREVGTGQMCGVAVSQNKSFTPIGVVVSGSGGQRAGCLPRHPGRAPSSRNGARPGAGRMVAGALANE